MQSRSILLYELSRLAPGSFDVFLDGVVVASLARSGPHRDATWSVELLLDLDQADRPPPPSALSTGLPRSGRPAIGSETQRSQVS
jgi:hypothetical protein